MNQNLQQIISHQNYLKGKQLATIHSHHKIDNHYELLIAFKEVKVTIENSISNIEFDDDVIKENYVISTITTTAHTDYKILYHGICYAYRMFTSSKEWNNAITSYFRKVLSAKYFTMQRPLSYIDYPKTNDLIESWSFRLGYIDATIDILENA